MKQQKGFTAILIVIVIAIVGLLGFITYQFFPTEDINPEKSMEVAKCGANLFDTHTHLDDQELPVRLAQGMHEYGVTCAAIFVQMNPDNYDEDKNNFLESMGNAPNIYLPFFDVVRDGKTIITQAYLDKIYTENKGKFVGFGEFALYRPELSGTDLTGEPWNTIFKFAGEHDLFVMLHPSPSTQDLAGLKSAMSNFPKTKFIVHGFEFGVDGYVELLNSYPNFYFTLDTATMLKENGLGSSKHLMYPNSGGSEKQFLSEYSVEKNSLLSFAQEEWAKVILAAPDRVMWGTDVSFDWHANPKDYSLLIEFSNEFISSLPEDVQEKYAYQNAVSLFGGEAFSFEQIDGLEDDHRL